MTPPSSGSIFRKYKPKSGRRSAFEGLEIPALPPNHFGFKELPCVNSFETTFKLGISQRMPNIRECVKRFIFERQQQRVALDEFDITRHFFGGDAQHWLTKVCSNNSSSSISNNISDKSPMPQVNRVLATRACESLLALA